MAKYLPFFYVPHQKELIVVSQDGRLELTIGKHSVVRSVVSQNVSNVNLLLGFVEGDTEGEEVQGLHVQDLNLFGNEVILSLIG